VSSDNKSREVEPLAHHPDDALFPAERGTIVVFLGKEALLSWFTSVRSNEREEVIDRLHHLGQSRAVFTTSIYQLVEVFTKVRYEKSAEETTRLAEKVADSRIRILHGTDEWDSTHQMETPKEVFEGATETFENRPCIQFSFPEAALVLALTRENRNRTVPVYLFTFDGTLATLADTFDVPVLPYSTLLRDDSGR
jgi:hypothetical protein